MDSEPYRPPPADAKQRPINFSVISERILFVTAMAVFAIFVLAVAVVISWALLFMLGVWIVMQY